MRGKIVYTLAGVLAVALALACGTGDGDPRGEGADVVTASGGPPPAPAEGPPVGSLDNPLPVATTFRVGDWQVTLATSNTDATDVIVAENQFNTFTDGWVPVMAEASVAYVGTDSGVPWVELSFSMYAAGRVHESYGEDSSCGVLPDDLGEVGELFPEAPTASGNVCVAVPADQADGALWLVEPTFTLDDGLRTYVALS